jgi:DNA polymerase-3 subunit gamma/tau
MAYQVLARKWRPQSFDEIVGQDHVSQPLVHALQHQRLHHAYLFTGTRGVGKTTIARILAKAINCDHRQQANPCGQCNICRDFDQGRFIDLIEVDAASRTKVEDTRDLLDNVQYAPHQGRYKIYLIDEVHMLSGHSFNALLKTLEEPPSHVKFLLATTDPQKIPVTVLSRCLQFNLKPLLPQQIEQQMDFILHQEKIEFDLPALSLLAQAADGSLRDGLSLLDQAIVFGQGQVNQLDVRTMLGTVAQQPVEHLLRLLAATDGPAILEKIAEIAQLNVDFNEVLQQLLRMLHRISLLHLIPNLNETEFDQQMLLALVALIPPDEIQLYYQMALIGQKDLALAPDVRIGFEMLMLRMLTFKPISLTQKPATIATPSAQVIEKSIISQTKIVPPLQNHVSSVSISAQPPEIIPSTNDSINYNDWVVIIQAMSLKGMTKQLADNCILKKIDEHYCYLEIEPNYLLTGTKYKEKLEMALQGYYQKPLQLRINPKQTDNVSTPALQQQQVVEQKQQAAIHSINSDVNVDALKEHFDAKIISGSITPIDTP